MMKVHRIYPEFKRTSFWKRNRQDILRSLFLTAGYICLLVNLLTHTMLWSLIVIGGLCVIWTVLIYRPLVENTLIKKLSDISIVTSLYLVLLSAIVGGDWGKLVVPIFLFADLLAIGLFYLLFFKREKRNFMPLLELILGGMAFVLYTLFKFHTLIWPQIVLASVSLGLLLLTAAIFPRETALELKKKLHR